MENLLASFQIAYVLDIGCAIALFASAIVGAKKGFVKCFFGFVATLVALILALTLASTVAGWMSSVFGAEGSLTGKLETMFLKKDGFNTDVSAGGIAAALENMNMPGFLKDIIIKNVSKMNDLAPGTTLAGVVAPVLSQFLGLLISGIVIFIAARLVLLIIEKILTKIVRSWSLASALNGLLGCVVELLKTAIIICGVIALVSLLPWEGITTFFDQTLVVKYIFHNNPIPKIWGLFIKM